MKKWIARWFGRSSDAGHSKPSAPAAAVAVAVAEPDAAEVDTVFYRWIAGAGEHDALPSIERMILDELARLAATPGAGADLVPRVPAVIPQLLRSLRDEAISATDLSRQLAQDVVLVAEVIREANSPYYRPAAPIKTIEGAVMLLGQNGMRMLIARVAFRPVISMQSGHFARQAAPALWTQSEKCALAANLLAPSMGAAPFEAYLAGLMHNVGLIVAFRLIDQIYSDTVLPQSDAFCAALFAAARSLSARIAALWDFPPAVAEAIAQDAATPLALTLARADRIAKLRMLVDAGQFAADDPFVTEGMDAAAKHCFDKLTAEDH